MQLTRWRTRVDAAPLGVARIVVGIASLAKIVVIAPWLYGLTLPDAIRLPWWNGWTPSVTPFAVIAVWTAAGVAFTAGFRTRRAGTVLCLLALLILSADRQLYSNHLYLLAVLVALLVVSDAGATRSFDAGWRSGRTIPGIGPDLIRIQVSIVYAFAALWKLNVEFLSGAVLGLYLQEGFLTVPAFAATPVTFAWLALMTILAELFVAFGLWSSRLRPLAAATGCALHIAFVALIAVWGDLVVFGLLMVGCYPLFFALRHTGHTAPARAAA